MREMVAETQISLSQLIQPYFVTSGNDSESPIKGFTEVYRWGIDKLSKKIESDLDRGLKQFLLFGDVSPEHKDPKASALTSSEGLIPETLRKLKQRFGREVFLFTDVCLCAGTDSGHCGVVAKGEVENDSSVKQLAQIALTHAQAGADFVAPSDMMDGRIGAIRRQLDSQAYSEVGILAYTAKYASYYYGPFREALGSFLPRPGEEPKRAWQLNDP
jgi:porphobilinogen synthase